MPEQRSQAGAKGDPLAPAVLTQSLSRNSPDSSAVPVQTGQATGATRTGYLPQLDGLRALAVIMVFLHHALGIPLLWSGVDLFFILSGYLITNILLRDSGRLGFGRLLGHFYLRRAQRILPAYVVCLGLIALFTTQDWARLWPFYAFFLQNVPYALRQVPFGPLIPLWSLAVEQHFYLVWPFLVYFLPRRYLAPSMVALLLGVPLLRAVCTPLFAFPEPIYVLTPFRVDAMAAGALAALWLPLCRREIALRWAQLAILVGVLVYALLAIHPWFRRDANTPVFNGMAYSLDIVILGGLFVWAVLADPKDWLTRVLACAPMRGLGRISYAFYLVHLLVLTRFGPYFSPHVMVLASFIIAVCLGTVSWYCLERPILSLGGGRRGAALKPRIT